MQNPESISSVKAEVFFADDGEPIHVHVVGKGEPIVMLHGWTADHREWQSFIKDLSKEFCLYLWDARGHGAHVLTMSQTPDVQRMARDLDCLMRHYALRNATVVGHSMGALTLWQYLRDFGSDGLARLCLIDQSPKLMTDETWKLGIYGGFDRTHASEFEDALHVDFAETVLKLSALSLNARARKSYEDNTKGWQLERQRLLGLAPTPLIAIWRSLVAADYREVLKKIDVPTLLIYGEQSNFYPIDTAHYVQQQIPGAVLEIYDKTDHCPHLWQPARFIDDLRSFIHSTRAEQS